MRHGRGRWPIIIGGCYRSGTSLLRRMLNAHPRVHCGPEVKFFRDFYGDYIDDPFHHLRFSTTARTLLPEDEFLTLMGGTFVEMHERAAQRAGKARWADKTPDNVLYLDGWNEILGDRWLFIHVVRNPLDTLASITEAGFPLSIPPDLDGRIELYRRFTIAGNEFGERFPRRTFRLVYEELVGDPTSVLGEVMDWLGERLHPRQLAFNDSSQGSGLEDPKIGGASLVHTRSVGRWSTSLSPDEVKKIRRRTRDIWASDELPDPDPIALR